MIQPLRIVYLIGQLGLGGSERQLYLLLKHMDKTRFEPHVVVFNPSNHYTLDRDLHDAGVRVYEIPQTTKGVWARMLWLYSLFRRLRPHVVHSWTLHDNPYAGLIGWLGGASCRLGSVRGSLASADYLRLSRVTRWLILHSVQGYLVNSDAIAGQLRAAGIPAGRIHVLQNCVETDSVKPAADLDGIPPGVRVVGMVGNLRREKNYPMFVQGMARVIAEFDQVYGAIVGQPVLNSNPDIPDQVRTEIEAQNAVERIRMIGFRSDIPAVLSRFEIFCLTSDSEGTPNAALEAMAAGLPVVATRVGGIPRLVEDGVSGFLVDPGDVRGLVEALRALLRDPVRARQMGAAGRQRVETRFGCGVIAQKFELYYLEQFTE